MQTHFQAGATYKEMIHDNSVRRQEEMMLDKTSYQHLFLLFLKIGATSWGGFMALISMIRKQLVEKEVIISDEEMVHAVSLASILPGPVAVNVVAYIGYKLKGIKGAFVCMTGVLLPCFLFMLILSYTYFSYNSKPSFASFFLGIVPAVSAIIFNAAIGMRKKNVVDVKQAMIALVSLLAILFLHWAYTTLLVILLSGLSGYFFYYKKETATSKTVISIRWNKKKAVIYAIAFAGLVLAFLVFSFVPASGSSLHIYSRLITVFSGLSISQFGGGYVIIPTLQKAVVDSLHWLTQQQFTDAIAMGQITPGPIYISTAFVGYKLAGIMGALLATIAMFLPASLLMIVISKLMSRVEKSPVTMAAFKGIGASVTGMISASGILFLYNSGAPWLPLMVVCSVCFVASYRFQLSPLILIPLAGIAGLLIF